MPATITPKQAALWFASQGHPILPLHAPTDTGCTCGRSDCPSIGKHPFAGLVPHGAKDATTDIGKIRSWFDERYWLNFGVCTDALLTIDVDVKHSGLATWADMCGEPTRALIHTWQVRTGGGGLHVMFKNSANIRCGSLDKGIDVRGIGGYVVGPTCRHARGDTYQWLPQCSPLDVALAEPPAWLLTTIRSRSHCGRPASLQDWRALAGTRLADGERHKQFLRLAGHLIANPLNDPVEIRELLLGWNRGMCDPPLTDKDALTMIERLCERELAKEKWL